MPVNKYSNESKICPVCLRGFNNRKSWAMRDMWEKVIYCSDKCRKNKVK